MRRSPLHWIAGLVLGISAGLAYGWLIAPPDAGGTSPASLRADYRDDFRSAIASAYAATGNLPRAKARLALLGDDDAVKALAAQAQRELASGEGFEAAQDLALLGADLRAGVSSFPTMTLTFAPVPTASKTATPAPTLDLTSTAIVLTASPGAFALAPTTTNTPAGTPAAARTTPSSTAPFRLVSQEEACDPGLTAGLLQITVYDHDGRPLSGVEITVTSTHGEERFFTGLQPEISLGYADFRMQMDSSYSIQVARRGTPLSGLRAPECKDSSGQTYAGGLELVFRAP